MNLAALDNLNTIRILEPTNITPMKTTIYSLLSVAACGIAIGQTTAYTTPVGYTTKTLAPNQFTLVGLTLHNPTIASGTIDAESATSVTDNDTNFSTALTAGSTYILELSNGALQEITSWSQGVLTTPNNITSFVAPGDSYKIRKAATIAEIFGANNNFGLGKDTDGTFAGTDFIMLQNASGAFDSFYYFDDGAGSTGWFSEQGDPAGNKAIAYPDGFFVKRAAGSPITLVISGEVKKAATGGVLNSGFNYLSGVAPAGLTLGTSGLQAFVAPDTDGSLTGTDTILIQQSNGTYVTAYYFNDTVTVGWYTDAGDSADNLSLDGGLLIKSITGPKAFTMSVPASYSGL